MQASGTALVTGASRGIGRAVALELARRGFDVVASMRDPAAGASLTDELGAAPTGTITVERIDVTDPESIAIPDGLRVLVNNAAVEGENLSLEDTPIEHWRWELETNVVGLVEVTRRALPVMRASGGGVIVNVSSAGLFVPMPFFAVYRATKAAVTALSESLRAEVAPLGIQVVEVYPGPIDTDMFAGSKVVPDAQRSAPYAALAEQVGTLRGSMPSTPVADAAALIVDAICADPPPHRMACDPTGGDLLAGWSTTPDADWQDAFLSAFRLPPPC
jgi:NAD(P)-dependent dehydrogenase (short-subunit alcohol dehydrogenase family)